MRILITIDNMTTLVLNKKASFDFEILEKFEAGIELRGFEVKALRIKRGALAGARVIVRGEEAYVVGMDIPPYQASNTPKGYDSQRTRRLLLKKSELKYLTGKGEERGLTIIPIRVYSKGRHVKLEIAIARGKKKEDKRQKTKERESKRKIERSLKQQA